MLDSHQSGASEAEKLREAQILQMSRDETLNQKPKTKNRKLLELNILPDGLLREKIV